MSVLDKVCSLPIDNIPKHVAIIMDGNGRWAQSKGKPRSFGHKAGVETVRSTIRVARQLNIKSLTVFAFSSENWNRPDKEVSLLMELFMMVLNKEVKNLHKNNVKLKVIGDISQFSSRLQKQILKSLDLTKNNSGLTFNVAANYGGRWDITQAAKQLCLQVENKTLSVDDITEQALHEQTCFSDQAELDLLIRTGGERRISNFLLWQAAYAELYFSEKFWPDFDENAFAEAVLCFANRNRRYGLTGEQIDSK